MGRGGGGGNVIFGVDTSVWGREKIILEGGWRGEWSPSVLLLSKHCMALFVCRTVVSISDSSYLSVCIHRNDEMFY